MKRLKKNYRNNILNGLSLSAIQGANAFLPILAFPYLLSVLGTQAYSLLVIAEAISLYALILCLYGFDTSGVLLIQEAVSKGKILSAKRIYFDILYSRLFLWCISSILVILISLLAFRENVLIFLVWLFFPLGMILQANYFFQAIEKNIFLAVSVLVSRVITLLLIIISVKGPEDVLLSASILSFGFFFSGLLSFFYVLYNLGWPYLPKMQNSVRLIFEGRHLFTGNASVALFRSANVLILAIVANDAAVASYSLAEKYVKSGQALTRPLNQFFVPKAIAAWQSLNGEEKIPKNAYSLIWQKTKYQFFSLNLLIPLFVLAIAILSGGWGDFIQSSSFFIFIVMVPSIYFGVLNAMFGAVGLNMLGHQAYFAKAVFITGVVSFGICIGASYYFEAYGAAFSYVLAEMILFYLFYRNYHNS